MKQEQQAPQERRRVQMAQQVVQQVLHSIHRISYREGPPFHRMYRTAYNQDVSSRYDIISSHRLANFVHNTKKGFFLVAGLRMKPHPGPYGYSKKSLFVVSSG
jgi:hypothetical protein